MGTIRDGATAFLLRGGTSDALKVAVAGVCGPISTKLRGKEIDKEEIEIEKREIEIEEMCARRGAYWAHRSRHSTRAEPYRLATVKSTSTYAQWKQPKSRNRVGGCVCML
jgi:hypothetical protein